MAVFLMNECKFHGCGLNFSSLSELIQHIEETHLDSDPRLLEKQELQQPASLALSYILRLFTDVPKRDVVELAKKSRPRAQSPAVSIRSITPTGNVSGSEMDDESLCSEDEDSDDSWTTQEEFSSELILSMMQGKDGDGEKPYSCPVPGCKKRYKNVNGMKYHAKHGHKKDTKVKKPYRCSCGKSYKTAQGLRNHSLTHHPTTDILAIMQRSKVIPIGQLQAAQVTPVNQITQVTGTVQQAAQGTPLPVTMVTQAIPGSGQPGITPIPIAAVAMTATEKKEQTSPQAGQVPPSVMAPTTPSSVGCPITVAMATEPIATTTCHVRSLVPPTTSLTVASSAAAATGVEKMIQAV